MPATANRRHLLIERSTRQKGTPRVDLEAGIIYDVKFLGNDSENGRRYGLKCRRDALPLYEGASVNQNHPENERKLDRKVQDWVGVLRNVRAEADGNYGDLHLLTEHRDYKVLMEAATKFWQNFGLSHVAFGDGKKRGGVEEVQVIEEVRSVDIVLDPATCSNLFESRGRRGAVSAGLGDWARCEHLRRRIAEIEEQHAADDRDFEFVEGKFAEAAEANARFLANRRRR